MSTRTPRGPVWPTHRRRAADQKRRRRTTPTPDARDPRGAR